MEDEMAVVTDETDKSFRQSSREFEKAREKRAFFGGTLI
jgi:hypothetical protein